MRYPKKGSEWLTGLDAELGAMFANLVGNQEQGAKGLEVGVWKGAWSIAALLNSNITISGIDPYPGGARESEILTLELQKLNLDTRFQLFSNWYELPGDAKFDLIHVDGLHTEEAVALDLNNAISRLSSGGVLIVDDFRHKEFPGVTAAVFKFLLEREVRIFLDSGQKAYLCHSSDIYDILRRLLPLLAGLRGVKIFDYSTPELRQSFYQAQTVFGEGLVLVQRVGLLRKTINEVYGRVPAWIKSRL